MTDELGRGQYKVDVDNQAALGKIKETEGVLARFGANLKTGIGTAIGASLAIGFGVAAKGAAEMERAQGNFQAATGRSREEAVAFSKDMNALMGTAATVGRSFEDVASAGTAVAQQFEKTGAEGAALAQDFLAFSKVTGQDATGAVNDFDAALDAFGEPAERATSLMDQLVASNQKYGTDAGPAAVSALQGMAPALQAMGAGLDDGVGLLNLFESAGLDAGAAQRGLQRAIQDLKPGETLDDLIARLGAIEDPTKRAQAAMEIFGTRSGAGLANAIRPGMRSLDEFIPAIEDVAGKTDDAAESMLTTSDKFRMFADKAIGHLRGIGQEFGPLLSGIGAFGSLLGPTLAKGLGGLKGTISAALRLLIPGLLPAAIAVGSATGGAQATAHEAAATSPGMVRSMVAKIVAMSVPGAAAGTTVGMAVGAATRLALLAGLGLGLAAGIGAVILQATAEAKERIRSSPETITPGDLFDARAPMWAQAKVRVATEMQALGQGALDAFNAEWDRGIAAGLSPEAALEPARQAGLKVGTATGQGVASGIKSTHTDYVGAASAAGQAVSEAYRQNVERRTAQVAYANAWGDTMRQQLDRNQTMAAAGGRATGRAHALGLLDVRGQTDSAWDSYLDILKNAKTAQERMAELSGRMSGKKMAQGLNSSDPLIRAAAQEQRALMSAEWQRLYMIAWNAGQRTGVLFGQGLDAPGTLRTIRRAANNAAAEAAGALHQKSPAKYGPLSEGGGSRGWGEKVGNLLADGLDATVTRIRSVAARAAGATRMELPGVTMPSLGLAPSLAVAAAAGGAGGRGFGGQVVHRHYHVSVNGPVYGGALGLDALTRELKQRLTLVTRE